MLVVVLVQDSTAALRNALYVMGVGAIVFVLCMLSDVSPSGILPKLSLHIVYDRLAVGSAYTRHHGSRTIQTVPPASMRPRLSSIPTSADSDPP